MLVVSINNILDAKVEKAEIIITTPSHLPKTFKMKRSVGKSENLSTWIYKSSTIYWKKVSCMKMLLSLMPTNAIIPSLWKILINCTGGHTRATTFFNFITPLLRNLVEWWISTSLDNYPSASSLWHMSSKKHWWSFLMIFIFVSKFCTYNSMILFKIILP